MSLSASSEIGSTFLLLIKNYIYIILSITQKNYNIFIWYIILAYIKYIYNMNYVEDYLWRYTLLTKQLLKRRPIFEPKSTFFSNKIKYTKDK